MYVLVPYAPRQRLKRLARRPLITRGGSDEPPSRRLCGQRRLVIASSNCLQSETAGPMPGATASEQLITPRSDALLDGFEDSFLLEDRPLPVTFGKVLQPVADVRDVY